MISPSFFNSLKHRLLYAFRFRLISTALCLVGFVSCLAFVIAGVAIIRLDVESVEVTLTGCVTLLMGSVLMLLCWHLAHLAEHGEDKRELIVSGQGA